MRTRIRNNGKVMERDGNTKSDSPLYSDRDDPNLYLYDESCVNCTMK